ncbi:flagellar hook-basal body complex protein [Cohnella sp. CFH 77786]|uniref:flagellar hook-basal body protein n=1 Tax=Cohnella sp. CFH 77786 TaxID=2662265 RepID=UPI001C608D5C|nr:flagellar hook-basal body protein [Cohnella sp. CFH 77786]MBW5445907.1 flagellar hook-basal body complex protein [Cohnella sp. CFH 77786]
MNNSMISASASIGSLQRKLDMLADNIANINTVGYKRKTSVFEDLLTSLQPHEEAFRQPGRATPPGFTLGWGVRLSSMMLDMTQGALQATGNPNDVAIEGNALFEITMPDGTPAYTRHGAFQLVALPSGDRQLVTDAGMAVRDSRGQNIIVPAGRTLTISPEGTLTAVGNSGTTPIELGQLQLVQVLKPELLRSIGDNLYGIEQGTNPASVLQQLPARPVGVAVRQGFTEQSNVSLTDEMADLMSVQRAYQLNARALTSADQMLGMANNLRG